MTQRTQTITIDPSYTVTVTTGPDGSGGALSTTREAGDAYFDTLCDGMESLILAQACAGIDITTPEYFAAVQTTVETFANQA